MKKKLSIEKCQAILKKHGRKYSLEQVEKIRGFFYLIAELSIEHFHEHQQQKQMKKNLLEQ